jgi:hypothetical protein
VNRREKLAALCLSLALWLVFFRGFKPTIRTYSMPVTVRGLGRDVRLGAVEPERVDVRLAGLAETLDRLQPADRRVYLDLDEPGPGSARVPITEDDLRLPASIRFRGAQPAVVEVRVAPRGG